MEIQSIIKDDRKKKFLIIGLVAFIVAIGLIFFLTRTGGVPEDSNDQLLSDIALLAPKDNASQNADKLTRLPIISLSADNIEVSPGQPTVISWASPNAVSCVDGNGNDLLTTGSISITPTEAHTMDVICTNPKGTSIESISIGVTTEPIIALSAYPSSVRAGSQSFISWSTINTTRCVDSTGKTLRLNDSFSVVVKTPYTFKMSCVGPKGESKNSVTISIAPPQTKLIETKTTITATPAKTTSISTTPTKVTSTNTTGIANIELSASKLQVKYGESSNVSWKISGATNCSAITTTGAIITNKDSGQSVVLSIGQRVPTPPKTLPLIGDIEVGVLEGRTKATIIIQCSDSSGKKTERSITVTSDLKTKNDCLNYGKDRDGKPSINPFGADPSSVYAGNYSDITWNATCATMCTAQIVPWGKIIEKVDTSNIRDFVEGTDYNRYYPISNGGVQIPVNVNGGVRVFPGEADPLNPEIPTSGDSFWGFIKTISLPTTSTVTIKCTNNDASGGPRSRTSSVSVSVIPPSSGSCGGWISCTFGW